MPVIWGCLEQIGEALPDSRWIRVTTALSGEFGIRIRVLVEERTRIVRGIEQIKFSQLRGEEFAEVVYHCSHSGLMAAEQIYVRPDHLADGPRQSGKVMPVS
jgi:hypothetical protein